MQRKTKEKNSEAHQALIDRLRGIIREDYLPTQEGRAVEVSQAWTNRWKVFFKFQKKYMVVMVPGKVQ